MKVAEIMSRDVCLARPDQPINEIAKMMADRDIGFMPVGDDNRLLGMITDRDIVIRAVARGLDGSDTVRDVMTKDIKYCFEDNEIEDVVHNMGNIQVRRLPVVDRDKRLVGVVSLADAALKEDPEAAGVALNGIVEPGGQHSQSATH